jgi:hypothetical protein
MNKHGWILILLMTVYILFVMVSGGLIFWIGNYFSAVLVLIYYHLFVTYFSSHGYFFVLITSWLVRMENRLCDTSRYIYIGSTRIKDYRHFAVDVVSGWVVGAFAVFVSVYLDFGSSTGSKRREGLGLLPATDLVYASLI